HVTGACRLPRLDPRHTPPVRIGARVAGTPHRRPRPAPTGRRTMRPMQTMRALLFATALCASGLAWAQHAPDATAAAAMSSQKQAMARLSFMDGTWRGQARSIDARGEHVVTHTERVGTLLDGTIRLIEGHSYDADGN